MSQNNSKPSDVVTGFTWFCEEWLKLKTKMIETKKPEDIEMYEFFLLETRKDFTKLYAKAQKEWLIEFVGNILKQVTCELKEINIKYKNHAKP